MCSIAMSRTESKSFSYRISQSGTWSSANLIKGPAITGQRFFTSQLTCSSAISKL